MEDHREFVYRVDADNRIVFANENWYDFARENGVRVLRPDTVIGQPLGKFISHPETTHLFEILFAKLRSTPATVTLPYRCDSPDCRRFMELKLLPQPDRGIEFRSRILREEARDRMRLMEPEAGRTNGHLTMCGWCKKVALADGRWVEVEEAVRVLHLFDAPELPRISHGMCGECSTAFEQRTEKFFSAG